MILTDVLPIKLMFYLYGCVSKQVNIITSTYSPDNFTTILVVKH